VVGSIRISRIAGSRHKEGFDERFLAGVFPDPDILATGFSMGFTLVDLFRRDDLSGWAVALWLILAGINLELANRQHLANMRDVNQMVIWWRG